MKRVISAVILLIFVFGFSCAFAVESETYQLMHPVTKEYFDAVKISGAESYMDGDTIYVASRCDVELVEGAYILVQPTTNHAELADVTGNGKTKTIGETIILSAEDGKKCTLDSGTYVLDYNGGGWQPQLRLIVGNGIYGATASYDVVQTRKYAENIMRSYCGNFNENAFLADLDYDRIPEVLVCTTHSVSDVIEIYKYSNGKVIKSENSIMHGSAMYGGFSGYELRLMSDGNIKLHNTSYGVDWLTQENIEYYQETLEQWGFNSNYTSAQYNLGADEVSSYTLDNIVKGVTARTDYKNLGIGTVVCAASNYSGYSMTASDDTVWSRQKAYYNSYGLKTTEKGNYIILQIDNPNMNMQGEILEIDPGRDTAPIIVSGRTMIPIRMLIESVGGTVEWDASEQKVTLNHIGKKIELFIGKSIAKVDGKQKYLDIAPIIVNGRTLLPVRFVSENLGFDVDWNGTLQQVILTY